MDPDCIYGFELNMRGIKVMKYVLTKCDLINKWLNWTQNFLANLPRILYILQHLGLTVLLDEEE